MKAAAARWLDEAFPYRVCINLDRRPDRWRRVRRRFARHGLAPVVRVPAVDGAGLTPPPGWEDPAGAYGCLLSHLAVVRAAQRRGAPSVLIFEDDAAFPADFSQRFEAHLAELPDDWDMLHLGGLHEHDPVPVAPGVARLTSTYSTFAYAIRDTAYDAFLAVNGDALAPVDYNNRELQKELACYGFVPNLVWVDSDYSDAQAAPVSHWYLRESMVLKGSEIARAQRRTLAVLPYRNRPGDERAVRILRYLAERWLETLPEAVLVVVEQDGASTLPAAALPPACRRLHLDDAGPFDPDRCLAAAAGEMGAGRDLFFLGDGSLRLDRPDLRASLLMGTRFDVVQPFREVVELGEADTAKILGGAEVDTAAYQPAPAAQSAAACCVVSRRALEDLGRPVAALRQGLPRRLRQSLPQFAAPARALRLHGGPPQ
jgi:hypothetical protein